MHPMLETRRNSTQRRLRNPLTPLERAGAAAIVALLVILVAAVVTSARNRMRAARERQVLGQALAASKAVSAALTEEALFLAAVLSGVDAAIVVADRTGRVRFVNERFASLFGIKSAEVLGRSRDQLRERLATLFVDPDVFCVHDSSIEARPSSPSFAGDEMELLLDRPQRRILRWTVRPVEHLDERIGVVSFFRDVTREREAEQARTHLLEELAAQARTDALTLLANRRQAQETLAAEVDRTRRYGRPLGVVLFDLDHFKHVNDDFGHEAGDAVLRTFAEVLRQTARGTDVVARWGGEEFLAILHEADLDAASAFADRVRSALAARRPLAPFAADDEEDRPVTVSAGVAAMHPGEQLDAEALVRRADDALYEAKESGRDRIARSRREAWVAP